MQPYCEGGFWTSEFAFLKSTVGSTKKVVSLVAIVSLVTQCFSVTTLKAAVRETSKLAVRYEWAISRHYLLAQIAAIMATVEHTSVSTVRFLTMVDLGWLIEKK